jgi:ABC-type microcin C transport system duplicated ATPase subunit YejF
MPLYRKKPNIIEAFHFISLKDSLEDFVEFTGAGNMVYVHHDLVVIKSAAGEHVLVNGDYVVKDVAGNLFRLDQHTFEDLYDLVIV